MACFGWKGYEALDGPVSGLLGPGGSAKSRTRCPSEGGIGFAIQDHARVAEACRANLESIEFQ